MTLADQIAETCQDVLASSESLEVKRLALAVEHLAKAAEANYEAFQKMSKLTSDMIRELAE